MRPLLIAALTLLVCAAPASASVMNKRSTMVPPTVGAPLEGTGENMKIVGNVEIPGTNEVELAGDHAFVAGEEGVVIVNISDPKAPFIESIGECSNAYGDVDVNATATVATLAFDSGPAGCSDEGASGGVAIFDVTNKKAPVFKSFVAAPEGAHTDTLDFPYLYINNYDPRYRVIEIYDISDLEKPKKVSQVEMNGTAAHDTYVDHRPDGKTLLYSASIASHDVVDVTNPAAPEHLQKVRDNQVTISHQLEPNHKRDVLIATDEYGGGAASGVCGKSPTHDPTYMLGGQVTGAQSLGAVHFYTADADGTFALNGADKKGTFNIPASAQAEGCTAHVFWQAPSENRMTIGWYAKGVRVVDFSDPAQPKELGHFVPTGATTWAAKPHKGYVYGSDMSRGLDVYEYTGEGGKAWPSTSEPAEVTRLRRVGLTPASTGNAPVAPPAEPRPNDSRKLGSFALKTKLKRVPGKKGKKVKLTFTVTDASNVVVTKMRFNKKAGRKVAVRASGVAVAGNYRYVIRVGDRGKVLKRGRVSVKEKSGLALAPNAALVCRVR